MYLQPQGCYFLIQKWHLLKIFWEFHIYQAVITNTVHNLILWYIFMAFFVLSSSHKLISNVIFFTYTCIFKNILNLITFITCSWMYPPSANSDSLNSFAFHFLEGLGHDLSSNISKFIFSILLPIMINMDDFHALSKSKCQI